MTAERDPPFNTVRVYNMRFWMANKIHSFEELVTSDEGAAESEASIEINIEERAASETSFIVEEANNSTTTSSTSADDVEM